MSRVTTTQGKGTDTIDDRALSSRKSLLYSAAGPYIMALLRHADRIEWCPSSRVKRKRCDRAEFFSVRPLSDVACCLNRPLDSDANAPS
jgi:hypothetical protein